MATEGNGGLGSSEEVREGQLMDPAPERVADGRMEDSTQNTLPQQAALILRYIKLLKAREELEHLMKSGPAMVGGRLSGSLQLNRMATEGNGGLGSSEAEEGQLMDPASKRAPVYARQKQMRVRKAKADAVEVKHYKKKSKEKHVTPALDDDVRTLWGIADEYQKTSKKNGIVKVKDFLWKLGFDHKKDAYRLELYSPRN